MIYPVHVRAVFPVMILGLGLWACQPKPELAQEMIVTDAVASSQELAKENPGKYSPFLALDRNGRTAWCEGQEDLGINETFYIKLKKPIQFNVIYLYNGPGTGAQSGDFLNHGVSSGKKADYRYNTNPRISYLKVSATQTQGQKNQQTTSLDKPIKVPQDGPFQRLELKKTLIGDEIAIKIQLAEKSAKKSWRERTCITDISFGYKAARPDKSIANYPTKFFFNELQIPWDKFYNTKLKEAWKHVRVLNWYREYLLARPDYRNKRGYKLHPPEDTQNAAQVDMVLTKGKQFEIWNQPEAAPKSSEQDSPKDSETQDNTPKPQKPTQLGQFVIVTPGGVSIRQQPDSQSQSLATISAREKVKVLGHKEVTTEGQEQPWSRVHYQDKEGWLQSYHIKPVNPNEDPKTQQDSPQSKVLYHGEYSLLQSSREDGQVAMFSATRAAEADSSLPGSFKCQGSFQWLRDKEQIQKTAPDFGHSYHKGYRYILIELPADKCDDSQPPGNRFLKIIKK